ncbi:MAG TPA: hypothetical protein VHN98_11200, partial [Acidimicrobiales bacterium]|nr:hypothetical protein [Acidimicrobiales bacterium]
MATRPRPRLKPSQLVLILGVLFAIVVAASGIAATILQFHDESKQTRVVFDNIPSAYKAVFYTVL